MLSRHALPSQPHILAQSPLYSLSLTTPSMNHPHIPPHYSEEHRLIRIFASLPRGGGCFGWEISMGNKEKASPEGAWHLPSSLNNCRLFGRAGRATGTGQGAAGNGRSGLLLPSPFRKKCFNSHQRATASTEACRDRDQGSAPSTPQLCRTQWALSSRRCCKLLCPQFCHPEHVSPRLPPQEPQWGPPSPGWEGTSSRNASLASVSFQAKEKFLVSQWPFGRQFIYLGCCSLIIHGNVYPKYLIAGLHKRRFPGEGA